MSDYGYEYDEIVRKAQERVQECKDTIPGYREKVLERLIEREMTFEAISYNSNLDRKERCRKAEEEAKAQEHSTVTKCVCAKIKSLFGGK